MPDELVGRLAELHRAVRAEDRLSLIAESLVRDPRTGRALWDSYIPFVGPEYEPGGLLLVGTAQSLAKSARKPDDRDWRLATGMPDHPLYRLYRVGETTLPRRLRSEEVSFQAVAVQPFEDGIFAGIAGVALAALGFGAHEDLDRVARRVSVANFFKHSLCDPKGRDLRPWDLPRATAKEYAAVVSELYVRRELEILRPSAIVAFNGATAAQLRALGHPCVFGINDPSWLKQGGGFRSVDASLGEAELALHARYVSQMRPMYRDGMADRASRYLAKYHADFIARRF